MAHRPEIQRQWAALDSTMRFEGRLDPALKEEVRRSLAPRVGCVFCASLGAAADAHPDPKMSLAVAFAGMVFENFTSLEELDETVFAVLAEEFSVEEIVELVAWTCFIIGSQAFGAVLRLPPANAEEIETYTEWRAAGEASHVGART